MSFAKELKEKAEAIWEAGYAHPFVQELGNGTLPQDVFQFYLIQDYFYLLDYAKVFALGAVKADNEKRLAYFVHAQHSILFNELELHREYMNSFNIKESEYMQTKTSLFNRTYTANMIATAQTCGIAEILATLLPCAWTYHDYACRLKKEYAATLADNPYISWIEMYANPDFLHSFEWFFEEIDTLVQFKSTAEKEKITEIFLSSVEFEYLFWEMSYQKELGALK